MWSIDEYSTFATSSLEICLSCGEAIITGEGAAKLLFKVFPSADFM